VVVIGLVQLFGSEPESKLAATGDRTKLISRDSEPRDSNTDQIAAATQAQGSRDLLRFELEGWAKGGTGNVLLVDFSVQNGNSFAISDITIGCVMRSASGAPVGESRKTWTDVVRPGQSRVVQGFKMGLIDTQAQSAACYVRDFRHEDLSPQNGIEAGSGGRQGPPDELASARAGTLQPVPAGAGR
jgi:hypothetical protein